MHHSRLHLSGAEGEVGGGGNIEGGGGNIEVGGGNIEGGGATDVNVNARL